MNVPLPRRVHCVGVGGGGMSALAGMLSRAGHAVSGSDRTASVGLQELAADGVRVLRGHAAENLGGAELVVRSAAVPDDNPELVEALRRGLPVLKYSEAVGRIMAGRLGVAVAGTHGKTTTTALIAHLLSSAGADPGWLVGGKPLGLPTSAAWGGDERALVVEACEYDDSFLNLDYRVGAILGVAPDHLDWFGDEAGVRAAFARFAAGVPAGGTLVVGERVPDEVVAAATAGTSVWRAGDCLRWADVREDAAGYSVQVDGGAWGSGAFRLAMAGRHNLENLRVALCACVAAGVSLSDVLPHVVSFAGVGRRLQVMGPVGTGPGARAGRGLPPALVVDDFAHPPEELQAVAQAMRSRFPGRRLVGVFQPHQVSRTEAFLEGFAEALAGFDEVLLCDVFVARDAHPERAGSVLGELLQRLARARNAGAGGPGGDPDQGDANAWQAAGTGATGSGPVSSGATLSPPGPPARPGLRVGPAREAAEQVASRLRPGDVCLVMGAGDIDGLAAELARATARP